LDNDNLRNKKLKTSLETKFFGGLSCSSLKKTCSFTIAKPYPASLHATNPTSSFAAISISGNDSLRVRVDSWSTKEPSPYALA
jgi:hypothetical protein